MANQFTKAKEEGREPPKGKNAFTEGKREKMDPLQKAKIRAAFAADQLDQFMQGKLELSQTQVSAAKILMDKGMPSLQSIEQVNIEEPKSEEEIKAQLHALLPALMADPGTRAQIRAMLDGVPSAVDAPETKLSSLKDGTTGS